MNAVVGLTFASCFLLLITSIRTSEVEGSNLVCYLELWGNSRNSPFNYEVSDLPDNTCDYLVLAFLTLDPSTNGLLMHNGYTEVEPEQLRRAAESRLKSPGMKVLLSVGGWEDGVAKYSEMLSEKSRRRAFIRSVVLYLEEYKMDGLELHWLYPGTVWRGGKLADRENFVQLVKELTMEFKPRNWILTAAVPADEPAVDVGFNVPRLNSLLHQFHIRTFDLRGEWTNKAENHSPLYGWPTDTPNLRYLNVNDSIAMWKRKGASPRKMVPIFPLLGRSFVLRDPERSEPGSEIDGPGRQGPYTTATGILAYFEICENLQRKDWTRKFDSISQTPYAVSHSQWVGYDDEESLKKKAKLVTEQGLSGAALFAVSLDDFPGTCGQKNFLLNKMRDYLPFFHHDDYSSEEVEFDLDPRNNNELPN